MILTGFFVLYKCNNENPTFNKQYCNDELIKTFKQKELFIVVYY